MASMEKHLFNLKFAAKELERSSKKCDKVSYVEATLQVTRIYNLVSDSWGDNEDLQEGRGQRAVYYTSPQSFTITLSYSLA